MPLARRLPKRGFTNKFAKDYEALNIGRLASFEAGTVVDEALLKSSGAVSRVGKNGVKILGRGDLGVALHVRVSKLSRSAAEKIVAAGGTIEGPVPGE
jgi:large subunit ribosomal protein L15